MKNLDSNSAFLVSVVLYFYSHCLHSRDCRQMTFVCYAKNNHPLFLTDNIKIDRITTKIKWKIHAPFSFYVRSLRYFLWKFVRYSRQIFYFLLFLLAFTSADIIFHKVLELHPTLSEKPLKIFHFTIKNLSQKYLLRSWNAM